MAVSFTNEMWREIVPIYKSILTHPFIKGLTDGSLNKESFKFYIVQDALYLREFAKSLSIAAARSPVEDWIVMFNEHSAGALKVERSLHESFFRDFGIGPKAVSKTPLAPTNLAYTSYLHSVAYASPFHEVVGALLPCYWIYWEVGKSLISKGSPDPLYQRWIETYGGEEFARVVNAVLGLTRKISSKLNEDERCAMKTRFVTTSRYEWMFWDMGYRKEKWPV